MNKHNNCSKCNIVLNQDNYKKGRTVCKMCYDINVLRYYQNKFCNNPSTKSDVGTQTDLLDGLDSSNKQIKSRRQNFSSKQSISSKQLSTNKQDITINNIIDSDPNLLCDKIREILSKADMVESDYTLSKTILDELIRTKSIPRKDYNAICKNLGLV